MAVLIASATRRRNVSPVSSIIGPDITRDADCSGITVTPEDGEFIIVHGSTGSTVEKIFFVDDDANIDDITATDAEATSLRMVWGSAEHTDRRQSGHTRVPYFFKGMIVETNLYYVANDAALLTHADNGYAAGRYLSVVNADSDLHGADQRLVLAPIPEAGAGWAVGHLEAVPAQIAASGVVLKVRLYPEARFVGVRR